MANIKRTKYTLPRFRSFHKIAREVPIKTKMKMIESGRGISSKAMNNHLVQLLFKFKANTCGKQGEKSFHWFLNLQFYGKHQFKKKYPLLCSILLFKIYIFINQKQLGS